MSLRRRTADTMSGVQQEGVADNFCLLLDAIAFKWPPRSERITVAAERVSDEWQEDPFLSLPHMRHLVNKQTLSIEALRAEVVRIDLPLGVEPYLTIRCHHGGAGLEENPFLPMQPDPVVIDSLGKHAAGQGDFSLGKRASRHVLDQRACRTNRRIGL